MVLEFEPKKYKGQGASETKSGVVSGRQLEEIANSLEIQLGDLLEYLEHAKKLNLVLEVPDWSKVPIMNGWVCSQPCATLLGLIGNLGLK